MEETRTEAAGGVAQAVASADSSAKAAAASQELALTAANEDLEVARKSLKEREARMEEVERALADKVNERIANKSAAGGVGVFSRIFRKTSLAAVQTLFWKVRECSSPRLREGVCFDLLGKCVLLWNVLH